MVASMKTVGPYLERQVRRERDRERGGETGSETQTERQTASETEGGEQRERQRDRGRKVESGERPLEMVKAEFGCLVHVVGKTDLQRRLL
jgi:hypothetical protein